MRAYIAAIFHWLAALPASRFGNLGVAAAAMWQLNVLARRRTTSRQLRDWIYDLKNRFICLLYEEGYCVEAGLTRQVQECWGTWNYPCDEDCPKCEGTGIYSEHLLYDFTFIVDGVRYAWHQPEDLVDWPVQLTRMGLPEYQDPPNRQVNEGLTVDGVVSLSLLVWWALALRRRAPRLPLLAPFRIERRQSKGFYGNPGSLYAFLVHVRWTDHHWSLDWPVIPDWRVGGYPDSARMVSWLSMGYTKGEFLDSWSLTIVGRSPRRGWNRLRERAICAVKGHTAGYWNGKYCRRCYALMEKEQERRRA